MELTNTDILREREVDGEIINLLNEWGPLVMYGALAPDLIAFGEVLQIVKNNAYEHGYDSGFVDGECSIDDPDDARSEGYEDGYENGFQDGCDEGYERAQEDFDEDNR